MTKEEAIKRLMDEGCKSRLYCELYPDACMKEECEIYMAIRALQGRPKGKWRYMSIGDTVWRVCSCCGWEQRYDYPRFMGHHYLYCPHCGALMEGESDD